NGASATAISGGRSVDTSMGLTPLEGLVMGTRSGDVDPALGGYLARTNGMDAQQVEHALTHDSGLLALAGSSDMRTIRARDDAETRLALAVYTRRIRKYVGAYYALLGRVDAIVFTGGIGENDPLTRAAALKGLDRLSITVDTELNESEHRGEREVSPPTAEVPVLVIPTDEEQEIAHQTLTLLT
ncbi:acetate kinase, partial [Nonomuraea fuscirosea]